MDKNAIIEALEKFTVVEINDFVKELEERWGVSAAAPVAMAAAPAAAAAEEQTEFDVHMEGFGSKKIQVIKAVRGITSLGLKEAKELVESVPVNVKEGVEKAEAEKIKKELEAAGASVTIK